jgi:RimJ/RimL family protein N-acetyltransferase
MTSSQKTKIRPKVLADAPDDYEWVVDPELSDLDAATPLRMSYADYVEDYREQLRYASPDRHSFAIDTLDGKHIGNCVYYNTDRIRRETEIGIMIGNRQYWNQGYGADAMSILIDYVFRRTNFKRVYLKTLEKNIRAHKCFQKCGLTPCGHMERNGYRFLLMELPRSRWQEQQDRKKTEHTLPRM